MRRRRPVRGSEAAHQIKEPTTRWVLAAITTPGGAKEPRHRLDLTTDELINVPTSYARPAISSIANARSVKTMEDGQIIFTATGVRSGAIGRATTGSPS